MKRVEVVVVGAGPAGLAAAIAAATAGAQVLVIDEYPQPGGQIYAQPPALFQPDAGKITTEQRQGEALLAQLRSLPVEFLAATTVWGIFDGRRLVTVTGGQTREFWAEKLILAPGAFERPVPFPGWTLPGVMTVGGIQKMLKLQWVLPGSTFLLVGTGPLQLVLASQLIRRGAKVAGIADASSWRNSWRYLPQLLQAPRILWQGMRYLLDIQRAGIPFIKSHAICRVAGHGQVAKATTCDVDDDWHPIAGTERNWNVDTVCVGYGFVSSVELASLAGCRLHWAAEWNSWVPEHDADMRTSVPGIFVAGDGAGLGGSVVAQHEGHIAGVQAAAELGHPPGVSTVSLAASYRKLRRLKQFRSALDRLWAFKPGLYDVIRDDTLICRCEEVTYAAVKEAIACGAEHVNQVKSMTRAGMGLCQGRFCEINIAHLVAAATGRPPAKFTVRAPVKPLPAGALHDAGDAA